MEDFQEVECLYRLTSASPLHEKKKSAACVIRAEQRSSCSLQDKRPKSALKHTSKETIFFFPPNLISMADNPAVQTCVQGRENSTWLFLICKFHLNRDSIYLYSVPCRIIDYTAGLFGLLSGRSATEETMKAEESLCPRLVRCISGCITSFTVAQTLTVIVERHQMNPDMIYNSGHHTLEHLKAVWKLYCRGFFLCVSGSAMY